TAVRRTHGSGIGRMTRPETHAPAYRLRAAAPVGPVLVLGAGIALVRQLECAGESQRADASDHSGGWRLVSIRRRATTAPENETSPPGADSDAGNAPAPHTTAALGRLAPEYDQLAPGTIGAGDRAAVEALPPRSALLIVQHGPNAGARFLLDDTRVTAGRDTGADIFLDDVTVSRKHAEFVRDDGQFTVRDVGSLNGTYVNRTRIDEVVLQAGDE